MSRNRLFAIIGALCLLSFFEMPLLKAQIDPSSAAFETAIDSIFADKANSSQPGATVSIIKGKELLFSKQYGSANLAYGTQFTENTVFPLPGFSEQLLVFSILQLQSKGLLNLADPVNKFLPELGFQDGVSLSHLLHHTSGLPVIGSLRLMAGWKYADPFYQEDFLKLTKNISTDLQYDKEILHSHSGITILQMVMEKVTGQSFSEYAKANIFQPLDMPESAIKDEHYIEGRKSSIGYTETDSGIQRAYSPAYEATCPMSYLSQSDFERWMLNVQTKAYEGHIMEQLDEALMMKGEVQERAHGNYCIGQQQYYKSQREEGFFYSESDHGHAWRWTRLSHPDLSIMVVSNTDAYIDSKVRAIKALMVSKPPASAASDENKTNSVQLTEADLQVYTGFYWDSSYLFSTHISIKDGGLYYEDLENGWNFALKPLSKTMFESPPWNKVEITNLGGQKKLKLILMDGREFLSEEYDPKVILPKDFDKYTGIYASDKLNAFNSLVVEENRLIMKRSRKPDLQLIPIGKNKFKTAEVDFRMIEFSQNTAGLVDKMIISNSVLKGVVFSRL